MLLNAVYLVGGLALLVIGAEGLVRASTGIAQRLGVTALAIGLTVVAFGTGSPELVLSVTAARAGDSGIALGNVVGSNISNVLLVLGVAALVKPLCVRSELVRREMPLMIAVTMVLWVMLIDGSMSRPEGVILVVGAVAYTLFAYAAAKRGETAEVLEEFDEALTEPQRPAWLDAVMLGTGLAALLFGAGLLLRGATFMAESFGVSQMVIGLTVVAIGTSLPELATSVTSAARGEADVAFGNVIGSNVLNILAVLGVTAIIQPFEVVGLRPLDLGVLIASPVLLLITMRRGWVLSRWEGALLLFGYVAYMYSLLP